MNFIFEWLNNILRTSAASEKNIVFYHEKIKFISSSHRVIFFLLYRQEYFLTNNSVKAGNDIIDILTSEDMENTPLKTRM